MDLDVLIGLVRAEGGPMSYVADALQALAGKADNTLLSASPVSPSLRFVTPNGSALQRRADGVSTPPAATPHRRLPDQASRQGGATNRAVVNFQLHSTLVHGIVMYSGSGSNEYYCLPLRGVFEVPIDDYLEAVTIGDVIADVTARMQAYRDRLVLARHLGSDGVLEQFSHVVLAFHRLTKLTTGMREVEDRKQVVAESNISEEWFVVHACCADEEGGGEPPPPPPPPES